MPTSHLLAVCQGSACRVLAPEGGRFFLWFLARMYVSQFEFRFRFSWRERSNARTVYLGDTDGGAITLFMEMWLTPFDDLPANSTGSDAAEVVHHILEEGEIIGVGFSVTDDDAVEPEGTSATYSGYWVNSGDVNVYWQENAFVDYTLLGFDPSIWVTDETAVEEDSWGRIKSSFTN